MPVMMYCDYQRVYPKENWVHRDPLNHCSLLLMSVGSLKGFKNHRIIDVTEWGGSKLSFIASLCSQNEEVFWRSMCAGGGGRLSPGLLMMKGYGMRSAMHVNWVMLPSFRRLTKVNLPPTCRSTT